MNIKNGKMVNEETYMRVAIIGINGYIGTNLAKTLINNDVEVIGYDFGENCTIESIDFETLDITNPEDVKKIDFSCDGIVVLAGRNGTLDSFKFYKDFIMTNEVGLLNILNEHVNQKSHAKIVYPSSRLVYKDGGDSLKEDHELFPKTIYAANKIMCEYILEMYHNLYKIDYCIFRIGIPYGGEIGTKLPNMTIGFMVNDAKNSGRIKLFGGGHQKRTFTHINYICNVILNVCKAPSIGEKTFNIDGEDYSLRDVAGYIQKLCNATIVDEKWPEQFAIIETGNCCLNGEKLHKYFDVEYNYSIFNWIEKLFKE